MFHSVRARLTLWYTAILALVLVTFSIISYVILTGEIHASTDSSLNDTVQEVTSTLQNESDDALEIRSVLSGFRYEDREIILVSSDGSVVASSLARLSPEERRTALALAQRQRSGLATIAGGPEQDGIRVIIQPLEVSGKRFTAIVARDLDEQADRLESVSHAIFLGIPIALLLAAGGGYTLARKSLEPVTAMSLKARQIGAETLSARIEVENERDELGFLAITLNELLERLQYAFESQRRFMADASHELRTPVAIIQGEADVALGRSDRTSDEYRETIEIIQKSARKVTHIVRSLFLLARTDSGNYPVTLTRFYLDELVTDIVRQIRSVAALKGVEVSFETDSELLMSADEELIGRMLMNLVDNAVKFTGNNGHVLVNVRESGNQYEIRVSDDGPGITAENQERIFDRFVRIRRSGQTSDGAGLGLPIALWIAQVHQGSVEIERSNESGTVFLLKLPRSAPNTIIDALR